MSCQGLKSSWSCPHASGGVPRILQLEAHSFRCPHASGGVPMGLSAPRGAAELSPREWGCTGSHRAWPRSRLRCPHASGGVPVDAVALTKDIKLSPREWGCTSISPYSHPLTIVVPTRVGVYREIMQVRLVPECCPHASGGVPRYRRCSGPYHALSPREWGCTGALMQITYPTFVVPTRVGVYRRA